jgi:hypothetical protein
MVTVLAVLISVVFASISAIHVYWAAGGRRWADVVLPQQDGARSFTPTAGMTLMVALALLAAALGVLAAGGLGPAAALPFWVRRGIVGVLAVVFALRAVGDLRLVGLFRKVKGTPFAYWDARLFGGQRQPRWSHQRQSRQGRGAPGEDGARPLTESGLHG